jgi:predicted transcriptional regulator
MGTSVEDIISSLPPERQKRIQEKADQYMLEYKTLKELRNALGFTQAEVADNQGIKQVNISNLEQRSDMLLSTLRSYVESMGCELEVTIKKPDNTHVKIEDL